MNRLRVKHVAGFSYASSVNASYNEARMLPQDCAGQVVLSSRLAIEPEAQQYFYTDGWGTKVSSFEVLCPHDRLTLEAVSLVEVDRAPAQPARLDWAQLARLGAATTKLVEQSRQTARTAPPAEVSELAAAAAARHPWPHEAALAICGAIRDRVEYVQGVTTVEATAADAWAHGRGVCQDMAHIALGALRACGVPARYVSGYMHPEASPDVGVPAVGESHAWVEWFCGEWIGFDPTNGVEVANRHVLVGRGRDYDDVAPIRGVYAGSGTSAIFVEVEITRES
ncbi:MAG: transglutaminase family protein [Bifidobacteriaceae bacterium]|jgi:transglutaminase-like putative cysteine protease|nr:transglutaminase family protein [Bifidobacteriaceae bacterium]